MVPWVRKLEGGDTKNKNWEGELKDLSLNPLKPARSFERSSLTS